MARAPKLKVYRMAVGFHDAYVAAPSQEAADTAGAGQATMAHERRSDAALLLTGGGFSCPMS
jgi:electron transfer flavoprotein alpha/beta subunit